MKAVVLVTVLAACGSSERQTANGTESPTDFEPPPPPPPDETFEQMKARFEAEKPEFMARQLAELTLRYDLEDQPGTESMTRGKPVQTGVRTRLREDLTWDQLAMMSPDEIKANDAFPRGFMPLPHPRHLEGGMLFPRFVITEVEHPYLLLASDRRIDSLMLESLIQEDANGSRPDVRELIPKLVTGLLAHRKRGRWLNTQENTFALLAMDLYFRTYEKATPDFVARVWLGDDYAGDKAFRGRTTDYFTIPIPMKDVAAHDKQAQTIQKDGKGRLYYRVGMTYAPTSLKLEPADYGFVVTRAYEGVDDPKDVVKQADGSWKIKAGSRVRIRLTVVNENRRYHVAVVDPMPAGLEPMNPALAVTGPIPSDPAEQKSRGAYWWWYGPWYEHQNMRDERVEAFASLLWEGVHRYDYVARATTPGNFVVPPTKAEEMYMPETFGRGGSDRVIIE